MYGCIVDEFGHGEEFQPFLGLSFAEDVEVGFEFLVVAFHFPIGLWVVGQGESYVILEESCKFPGED